MAMWRFLAVALLVAAAPLSGHAQRGGARGGVSVHATSGFSGHSMTGISGRSTAAFHSFGAGSRYSYSGGALARNRTFAPSRSVRLGRPNFYSMSPKASIRSRNPPRDRRFRIYHGYGFPGWIGDSDGYGSGYLVSDDPDLYDDTGDEDAAPPPDNVVQDDDLPEPGYVSPPPPGYAPPPPEEQQSPAMARSRTAPARPLPTEDAVTLIFKDRRPPEQIHNYALTRTMLYVRDQHHRDIPVDELDVTATEKANQDAGVQFQLPEPAR